MSTATWWAAPAAPSPFNDHHGSLKKPAELLSTFSSSTKANAGTITTTTAYHNYDDAVFEVGASWTPYSAPGITINDEEDDNNNDDDDDDEDDGDDDHYNHDAACYDRPPSPATAGAVATAVDAVFFADGNNNDDDDDDNSNNMPPSSLHHNEMNPTMMARRGPPHSQHVNSYLWKQKQECIDDVGDEVEKDRNERNHHTGGRKQVAHSPFAIVTPFTSSGSRTHRQAQQSKPTTGYTNLLLEAARLEDEEDHDDESHDEDDQGIRGLLALSRRTNGHDRGDTYDSGGGTGSGSSDTATFSSSVDEITDHPYINSSKKRVRDNETTAKPSYRKKARLPTTKNFAMKYMAAKNSKGVKSKRDTPRPVQVQATASSKDQSKESKLGRPRVPTSMLTDHTLPTIKSGMRLGGVEDQNGKGVNDLHRFVRAELLEVFALNEEHDYHVGLRCVYCGTLPKEKRNAMTMSVFFPKSIEDIYRSVCTWQRIHFPACKYVPPHMKELYGVLKKADLSRGKKPHWIKTAYLRGFRNATNDRNGIVLCQEAIEAAKESNKRQQRPQYMYPRMAM